jgi:hypothetical protein
MSASKAGAIPSKSNTSAQIEARSGGCYKGVLTCPMNSTARFPTLVAALLTHNATAFAVPAIK